MVLIALSFVREHPAPSGALRLEDPPVLLPFAHEFVREHPAPPGALRRVHRVVDVREQGEVREHPAPPGALRQHQ